MQKFGDLQGRCFGTAVNLVVLLILLCAAGLFAAGVQDLSRSELAALLEKKAASYRPPPEATKVLPFDPAGWKTNSDYAPIGDPRAKKGGRLTSTWQAFPPNLRTDGPNSNLLQTRLLHSLIYESLLGLHPDTLQFIPQLATHWWISKDKRTFRFRLNPKARFSDGSEVTADDVFWSFWHLTQEDRRDPYNVYLFGGSFDPPRIIDKYTVEVHTKKLNWRLFLYFAAGMYIFPAQYIKVSGDEYLAGYQWRFIPGSGPYTMLSGDLKKPTSLTLTRRGDWWARSEKWARGLYNFDKLRFVVIMDRDLEFEKFKHGELDYFFVRKAQRWAEECDFEAVRKGWVKKRWITTEAPQGFSGFCFNMRKPPFNDRRVRLAWAYLFNRKKLMEKLFFNQYQYIDSYYPGRIWANPTNPKIRYNPRKAARLLEEAGYKRRNKQGILIGPDGKPFEVTLEYGFEDLKRIFTIIREDYEKAGIRINLKLIDPRTLLKKKMQREFTVVYQNWGGLLFPNPESSWLSDLADKPNTNNLPGFKNRRVDRLCRLYNVCFDQKRRVRIIREIDKLIFNEHPYALGWYSNRVRLLYWGRFGHPATYFSRIGDESDILSMWWYDPEKARRLESAMRSGRSLPQGTVEVDPWKAGEQRTGERP